jgi:hypothetical protein
VRLTGVQRTKIREFLKQKPKAYVSKDEQACRRFVEAVKWMSRTGAQWRLLVPGKNPSVGGNSTFLRKFTIVVLNSSSEHLTPMDQQPLRFYLWDSVAPAADAPLARK